MLVCTNLSIVESCAFRKLQVHFRCVLPFMQFQQQLMKMDVCTVMWSTCAAMVMFLVVLNSV